MDVLLSNYLKARDMVINVMEEPQAGTMGVDIFILKAAGFDDTNADPPPLIWAQNLTAQLANVLNLDLQLTYVRSHMSSSELTSDHLGGRRSQLKQV